MFPLEGSLEQPESQPTTMPNGTRDRRAIKSDRERLRRIHLNENFGKLASVLDPVRPKSDQFTVLSDAIDAVTDLRESVKKLKSENVSLWEEQNELLREKLELRQEKLSLQSETDRLQAMLMPSMPHWLTMLDQTHGQPGHADVSNRGRGPTDPESQQQSAESPETAEPSQGVNVVQPLLTPPVFPLYNGLQQSAPGFFQFPYGAPYLHPAQAQILAGLLPGGGLSLGHSSAFTPVAQLGMLNQLALASQAGQQGQGTELGQGGQHLNLDQAIQPYEGSQVEQSQAGQSSQHSQAPNNENQAGKADCPVSVPQWLDSVSGNCQDESTQLPGKQIREE